MLISSACSALSFVVVLGALEIIASPTARAADDAPIPVRDFFRHPERGYFRISPDGKTLAFMQPYERRMNIYIQPLAGGEPVRLTSESARDIPDHFWKGRREFSRRRRQQGRLRHKGSHTVRRRAG